MRRFEILLVALLALPITAHLQSTSEPIPAQSSGSSAEAPPTPLGSSQASELQFERDGKDLLVHMMIEGPANRQAVLTEYSFDDGMPAWDEPPIGVTKPRRGPPHVHLSYLVLVNGDLPGYHGKSTMTPPTPESVRREGRQKVTWRLAGFENWSVRQEDIEFGVGGSEFITSSEQLKDAITKLQKTIDEANERFKEIVPP